MIDERVHSSLALTKSPSSETITQGSTASASQSREILLAWTIILLHPPSLAPGLLAADDSNLPRYLDYLLLPETDAPASKHRLTYEFRCWMSAEIQAGFIDAVL